MQNLQRCESLQKLDLTVNFIAKAGLLSLHSLQANLHLKEIYLLGNPCTDWPGYRHYVTATLPQLKKLVGDQVATHCRQSAVLMLLQHLPPLVPTTWAMDAATIPAQPSVAYNGYCLNSTLVRSISTMPAC